MFDYIFSFFFAHPMGIFFSSIIDKIGKWFKELLIDGITKNLDTMFTSVNDKIAWAGGIIGQDLKGFNGTIYGYIEQVHKSVILPIVGIILTGVLCIELIQMVIDKNNGNTESFDLFRWIFRAFCSVTLASNAFKLVMAVFDVGQKLAKDVGNLVTTKTATIDTETKLQQIKNSLQNDGVGSLLGMFLISIVLILFGMVIAVVIFLIVYGRFMEMVIYASVAAAPMSTILQKGGFNIGGHYIKKCIALALQGFIMMFLFGCYGALVGAMDVSGGGWSLIATLCGYGVLIVILLKKSDQVASGIVGV